MSETEWRTLMQAARSLGISRVRAQRYAAYLAAEDRQVLAMPDGTHDLRVRLPALQDLYRSQRSRHGERVDGRIPAPPPIVPDHEKTVLREQVDSLYHQLLSEREQRLQEQAIQMTQMASMLSHLSGLPQTPLAPPVRSRAKPLRRSEPPISGTLKVKTTELLPLGAFPETTIRDTNRKATPNMAVTPSATLEEQLEISLPQAEKLPRKEIGKNGIAAAQWNGLTLVEDESFSEEPAEPETEENDVLEDIDAVSPKKKKQNWLLSLLDES